MPKYLSGRVKRTPQDKLTEDRYLYLGLDQAEPNLGDPPELDAIPGGETQYQIISVKSRPGERYWKEIGGGTIPAAHTVRDEGVVVPKNALFPAGNPNPNAGINSITDVNFVGLAVTVAGFVDQNGFPGTAVTVTVSAPGDNHQVLFNNDGEFATSSLFTFDNTVGIESVGIGTNLRVQGDLKLDKTIYDENNQPGGQGDLLVKTDTGGMIWQSQNAIRSGAGGHVYDVQFHNTAGLVDGASTNGGKFVYRSDTKRVGIGSTQPDKLLDVLGDSRFTGDVEFITSNEKDILFDEDDNSLIFGDSVKAKFGSDKDASIYHDDTDFYIDNSKGNIFLRVNDTETALKAIPDGGVELFYDDLKRFETTNIGIAVTGTNHSIHGEVGIQSHIKLPDNAEVQFGVNESLRIFRDTSNGDSRIRENGTGNLKIEGSDIIFRNSSTVPANNKIYAQFNDGGSVELYHNNTKKFETSGIGVTITGLTTTTDLSVTGFVTSHLIPGETKIYDLGSPNNAWRTIYAETVIGVDNEEFNFLKVGILTVTEQLHVSGISSFVGIATFNDLHVTNLEVTGISTFVGIATFGDGIHVRSGVTTVGLLTVTGISTFNDDVIIGTGATVGIGSTVFFGDDVKVKFGSTDGLEIYHSETLEGQNDSYVDSSARNLYIRLNTEAANGGNIALQAKKDSTGILIEDGDAVKLYFDAPVNQSTEGLRLATTGYGVSVTGVTSTTNLYVTGISTFNNHIETTDNEQYDIGTENVGFRTVYAKEFIGKISTEQGDLEIINLKVTGISTFVGIATFGDGIHVQSGVTTVGLLTVSGIATFNANIDANKNLDVDGHTELDDLNVTGVSTFNDTVVVGSGMTITGISTFNNDIRTSGVELYDIGTESVGFRTVYAKEFNGKKITLEEDLSLRNLKVNGISTFIGIATFGGGINVTSGITTVGFLTAQGIFVTGVTTATDFNSLSDRNFKTNIQVIDNPIEKIMKIDGVSFNWKATNKPSFGVIADNVQETLPDLVNNEDPKTVNYNGLVGLLIEVVKNQQEQINELRGLLDK